MDASNLRELSDLAPVSHPALLLRFLAQDVPDPYYGDDDGFDQIFHMLSQGCEALLADLIERM